VRSGLPEAWPLVIVGPTGWGPELARPAAAEQVVFTGPVSDAVLSELYRRARAFAFVPLTEGYGLPPLEAMRAGVPTVVSAEVPSVHDLGAAGPAPARRVDPLDVDDIAEGLAAVLTDDALRLDLARLGTACAATRTWRATARAHIDLWRSLA
jgi:glycosyltransferase involved in cell wall biosynthesis